MTTTDRINEVTSPPTIRSTGIAVTAVLDMVVSGMTATEVVAREPSLEAEDVSAAVAFFGVVLTRPGAQTGGARRELGGATRRELFRYMSAIRFQVRRLGDCHAEMVGLVPMTGLEIRFCLRKTQGCPHDAAAGWDVASGI